MTRRTIVVRYRFFFFSFSSRSVISSMYFFNASSVMSVIVMACSCANSCNLSYTGVLSRQENLIPSFLGLAIGFIPHFLLQPKETLDECIREDELLFNFLAINYEDDTNVLLEFIHPSDRITKRIYALDKRVYRASRNRLGSVAKLEKL